MCCLKERKMDLKSGPSAQEFPTTGAEMTKHLWVCVCSDKPVHNLVPASVVRVGALSVVHVSREHVVVHVNGAAVVDGVAQPLCHDGLAGVRRQTQLEEAGLRGRQAVVRLWRINTHRGINKVVRNVDVSPPTLIPSRLRHISVCFNLASAAC